MYLLFKDDVTLDDMLYGIIQTYLIRSQLYLHLDDKKLINNHHDIYPSSHHHHHHQQQQQQFVHTHHHHHNNHANNDHEIKFHHDLLSKCYTNKRYKSISTDIINKIKKCHDWTLSESFVETNYNRIVME